MFLVSADNLLACEQYPLIGKGVGGWGCRPCTEILPDTALLFVRY